MSGFSVVFPGVAQFGSALEWGSRGREFDSRRSDQLDAEPVWGSAFIFKSRTAKGSAFICFFPLVLPV